MKVRLLEIASARSGDKNDICNIGVLAKSPEHYEVIKKYLTAEKVKEHFKGLIKGEVIRYEWPAIDAINFVCYNALDGGGSRSLRMDTLGKNFASHLLRIEIDV